MNEKKANPVPTTMENSIYVFPFIIDTDDLPKALINMLPEHHSFIRRSTTADLALVIRHSLGYTKMAINVLFKQVGNISFEAIFLDRDNKTIFPDLATFSKNRKLVLNLVKKIELTSEQIIKIKQTKRSFKNILTKINEDSLFNNEGFYKKYIDRNDKIEFSKILGIENLNDEFLLITFDNQTTALISKNQLLAALVYNSKLQEKEIESEKSEFVSQSQIHTEEKPANNLISPSINQTFLPPLSPPPSQNNKRKAEDDLDNPAKHFKNGDLIIEDSHSPAF